MSARAISRPGQRGFALVAVLMVLAFVAIIGAEFAYSMRLEATAARVYKENLIAGHLAEAGLEQAIREIAADYAHVTLGDRKEQETEPECPLAFYARDRTVMKRLPHKNVPLGAGQFSYCISDEQGRLNLNVATPARVNGLLQALGLEKSERDVILDSLQDWRDANEEHRLNGAESEDTYLALPVPYRSKNGVLDSVGELVQVKGITPKLMEGGEGRAGLLSLVTVKGPGQININTVSQDVARALGLSDAEFSDIEQARRAGPYVNPDPRYTARGINTVRTQTFRIEAEGMIEGQVRARLTAVVEKRTDAGGERIVVHEWSGIR
jgi:general secretion pathway protein K